MPTTNTTALEALLKEAANHLYTQQDAGRVREMAKAYLEAIESSAPSAAEPVAQNVREVLQEIWGWHRAVLPPDLRGKLEVLLAAPADHAPIAAEPVAMETTTRRPSEMIGAVWSELERACAKFPQWPTDPLHALAVLGEEFGELTKDVLQLSYEPGKTNAENVRKEAIQTAAMALRFVASLDTYIYKAGEQHRQDEWKAVRDRYADSGGLHPCYD